MSWEIVELSMCMDEWGSDGLWVSSHLTMTKVTSLPVQVRLDDDLPEA